MQIPPDLLTSCSSADASRRRRHRRPEDQEVYSGSLLTFLPRVQVPTRAYDDVTGDQETKRCVQVFLLNSWSLVQVPTCADGTFGGDLEESLGLELRRRSFQ